MRIDTIETEVYTFEELSNQAKEKALEKVIYRYCDATFDQDCCDHLDHFNEVADILGITIDGYVSYDVYQNYATFNGTYGYAKGALKKIKEDYPNAKDLIHIAERLQALQSRYFYSLLVNDISKSTVWTRYPAGMDVETFYGWDIRHNLEEIEEEFRVCFDYLTDYLLGLLRDALNYANSDECAMERIEIDEPEFTKDGDIYITHY